MNDNHPGGPTVCGIPVKPVTGWSMSHYFPVHENPSSVSVEFGRFDHECGYGINVVARQFAFDFLAGEEELVIQMPWKHGYAKEHCESIGCSLVFTAILRSGRDGLGKLRMIGECSGRLAPGFPISPRVPHLWWAWKVKHPLSEDEIAAIEAATDLYGGTP